MGVNLDQLLNGKESPKPMTSPKPLGQTEIGDGLLDLPQTGYDLGRGKVSVKKVSRKVTPGIKISSPPKRTSRLVVRKKVAPKLRATKTGGKTILRRNPVVRYKKATVGGLKVKV